jgi:hypothetical protein
MTPEEFFSELSMYKGEFEMYPLSGAIRHKETRGCPIITVCNQMLSRKYSNAYYRDAAKALNLSSSFAEGLSYASDSLYSLSLWRKKLLDILGLTEIEILPILGKEEEDDKEER